jgi:hemoglobin/transferrin/lactoferrin receptor protein
VLLPGKDWKISALVSSGFRAPNVDDMAKVFESVGGRVIIPNPELKAEKTMNMELNINKEFYKRLNIELNGYYTVFSNALTTGKAFVNGVDTMTFQGNLSQIITLRNAQNARISGVYAGLSYDLSKSFSVSGSVNYTHGRIKTDTTDYPLDHISPVFGRLSMTYKTSKYKMEIFTLFNGAKRSADYNLLGEDNQIYSAEPVKGFTPAWFTLNFRESVQLADGLLFQLAVENILDQHYRTFSSGYSAPGRNITLTLRRNF